MRLLFATAHSLLASLAPQKLHRAEPGANTLAVANRNRSLPARFARTLKAAPGRTWSKHACGCYSQPLAPCSLRSHHKGCTGQNLPITNRMITTSYNLCCTGGTRSVGSAAVRSSRLRRHNHRNQRLFHTEKFNSHTDSTNSTEFLIQQNLLLCCFVENMYRD